MSREWFTAAELAALRLQALPATPVNIRLHLQRSGTLDGAEGVGGRPRPGGGGGGGYKKTPQPAAAAGPRPRPPPPRS